MTHEEKKTLLKMLWEANAEIEKIAFGGKSPVVAYHYGENELLDKLYDLYFASISVTLSLWDEIDEEETK